MMGFERGAYPGRKPQDLQFKVEPAEIEELARRGRAGYGGWQHQYAIDMAFEFHPSKGLDWWTATFKRVHDAHAKYEAGELGGMRDLAWADWYAHWINTNCRGLITTPDVL